MKAKFFTVFFIFIFGVATSFAAEQMPIKTLTQDQAEEMEIAHAKIATVDASVVDPGHVELTFAYGIQGGKFAWGTDGKRHKRRKLLNHDWVMEACVGVYENIDIALFQGFARLSDHDNNYNEFAGIIDPATGVEMEDTTEGPTHGFGRGDLGIAGRWRFYNNPKNKLEVSYRWAVIVPTGRRSNLDHLGPSQGYTSLTNALVATKDIGRFTGNLYGGYTVPLAHAERTDNSAGTYDLNFALGYQVFSWLQPEIEVLWAQEFQKHGKGAKVLSVVAGVVMPIHDHMRIDLGIQQDIAGSNTDQTTTGIFKIILMT